MLKDTFLFGLGMKKAVTLHRHLKTKFPGEGTRESKKH